MEQELSKRTMGKINRVVELTAEAMTMAVALKNTVNQNKVSEDQPDCEIDQILSEAIDAYDELSLSYLKMITQYVFIINKIIKVKKEIK